MKGRCSGFTLIEMLVTVAVILTLSGLGVLGIRSTREKAKMLTEVNASRNLVVGYLSYAADNGGQLLAGFKEDSDATNLEGKLLHDPINARYPWRLAPHVPAVRGVMLYNGNESKLDDPNSDYMVSVHPNMGINATLVGGHFGGSSRLAPTPRLVAAYGKFYVSTLAECGDPNKLIVFASARHDGGVGYFEVQPPNLTGRVWGGGDFSESSPASGHGFVDFRWSNKAVVAMLGGNVELRTESDLRDMRLWSNQAMIADDADFTIRAIPR